MARSPTATRRRTLAASRAPTRAIELEERGQRTVSPLELGLIELPTRPRSVYTMGQRKAAIEACEQGLLRDAADLTLAAITESGYCRGILADLVQGILGLPRQFIGRPDMIAELDDTPERVGQFREMFPDPDTVRLLSWGVTLGVAPGQMRRKYGARASYDYPISPEEAADWKATKRALGSAVDRPIGAPDTRILRAWSPKWLRCQWWEDSSWYLMTADGEIRVSHLDDPPGDDACGAWFHAHGAPIRFGSAARCGLRSGHDGDHAQFGNRDEWMLFTPYGETKPWEWGAWKSATLAFIAERDATFDRLRHSEVLAPARVGQVPAGTTERQRKLYLRQLAEAKRMALYVLPPGLDYKIVESTGRVADVYAKIIEWAERQYAMITGALTTASGASVYAKGGDVQERFTRSVLSAFADALASCLHRYGLVPWSIANWGSPDAPRPEWDPTPPADKKTEAETLKTAADGLEKMSEALAAMNRKISDASLTKYMQRLGFETEALPVRTPHPKVEIVPTSRGLAYRIDEVRAGDGWPSIGDERGDMTLAEAEALAKQKAASGADPGAAGGDEPPPGDAPTDEAATALAAKMTAHGIAACGHGRSNKCGWCGVERLRDFTMGEDGQPLWHVAWQPIVRAPSSPPSLTNGAPHPPAWSAPGGLA